MILLFVLHQLELQHLASMVGQSTLDSWFLWRKALSSINLAKAVLLTFRPAGRKSNFSSWMRSQWLGDHKLDEWTPNYVRHILIILMRFWVECQLYSLVILHNFHLWETVLCIYSDKPSGYCTALHAEGHCVFESFKQSVTLNDIFWQAGQEPEQVVFREALLRIWTYSTNLTDFKLFSKLFWDVLPPEEKADFDNVLHLLPTQVSVLNFNCQRVASAKPILQSCAKHNHKEAKNVKSDDAEGLEKEVLLAERQRWCLLAIYGHWKGW